MEFGRQFEERLVKQQFDEYRDINQTLDLMWELVKILPKQEINRIDPSILQKYLRE